MDHLKKLCVLFLLICWCFTSAEAQKYPFQNTALDEEARIDNIISLLTIEEKINCLSTNPSVPRLNIKGTEHVEGLHGLAMGEPGNWGNDDPVPTTTFPQAIGMAQTWDIAALRKMGEIEGYEVRYMFQSPKYNRGGLVVRAPNADLGRDPRWGRTEECYGEDPYFNGTMVSAFINGLQGYDTEYWQAASLMKHFLANSNEDTRSHSSSDFDERLLHEYYAAPFRMGVVQGGSRAYMEAYNKVNEIPMMVSPLLQNLTVNQWHQNGIICTDGGALKLLISDHAYYNSLAMGAASAIKSGINQFLDDYKDAVREALDKGYITEQDIDRVIRGNFRVMIKLGMLDDSGNNPYAGIGLNNEKEPWLKEENKKIVREVTRSSIVLLKNDQQMLPLSKSELKSIALVGPLANDVLLDWYSGSPPYSITPLEGIQQKLAKKCQLIYIEDPTDSVALNKIKNVDQVIVFAGNHPTGNAGWAEVEKASYGKEAVDRKSMELEDEAWIKKVYAVNQHVAMVLTTSFPYTINWSRHNIPAIVEMAHNSQEQGNALADVLFGDYNPAGRLVQTWPVSEAMLPPLLDYNIRHGRTYMYPEGAPLYPFGYGLSYTDFEYKNIVITKEEDVIHLEIDLINTGQYDGDEVVQVYVKHMQSQVDRPEIELKGFRRIFVEKGQAIHVSMPIPLRSLQYWDEIAHKFVLEQDEIKIMVGASSDDIRLEDTLDLNEGIKK